MVTQLAADIIADGEMVGTTLPTEPELSEHFGVSRTVVREAMLRLARVGLVRIRQGAGTVVLERFHWNELDPELLQIRGARGLIADLIPDLLQIRRMVEVEVAGCAAQRRSDEDLARLAGLLDAMFANSSSVSAYNDADIAFHDALIAATGNDLLRQVMRPVNHVRRISSVVSVSRGPDAVAGSMAGHRAILDAVASRNPDEAREAMAHHIGQFERDLLAAAATEELQRGGPARADSVAPPPLVIARDGRT